MNKFLRVSGLASVLVSAAALLPGVAAAEEQGKVISSTPVLKKVTEPRSTCDNDADGKQRCRTEMVTEDRQIGFKVVYEYAGKQHTVQLPFAPGPTIPLDVTPTVIGATSGGAPAGNYTQGAYAQPPQVVYAADAPQVVERVIREDVYYDPYYPRPYYGYGYPYYYSPIVPAVIGLSLGLGFRGGYYRGGHGYVGHWRH